MGSKFYYSIISYSIVSIILICITATRQMSLLHSFIHSSIYKHTLYYRQEEVDAAIREGKEIPTESPATTTTTPTPTPTPTTPPTSTTTSKPSSKPLQSTKKTTPAVKATPMDSEGKPVSVDQHWKQFMEKSGKKKTVKRTHEETKKKKPVMEKKSEYVFEDDDDEFGKGGEEKKMKKIPLKKKK